MSALPLCVPAERPVLKAGHVQGWLLKATGRSAQRGAARALLAALVQDYCDEGAATHIDYPSGAAPQVYGHCQGPRLQASLSYAGDYVLLALAVATPVGVDLVQIDPAMDHLAVARLYLAPEVVAVLSQTNEVAPAQHFAQAWAEMEARSKCLGVGLAEWTEARGRLLGRLPVFPLVAPTGYLAVAAVG